MKQINLYTTLGTLIVLMKIRLLKMAGHYTVMYIPCKEILYSLKSFFHSYEPLINNLAKFLMLQ